MDRTIQYFQDRTELAKIVVQIRNIYPNFLEKSQNPKLIPKLDMTLFKKTKNPKFIPKLDTTLLILGLNQFKSNQNISFSLEIA